MNKLSIGKRAQIVTALVEGNSIRSTCRMIGTAKGTVIRLLRDVGKACIEYQDKHLRNLTRHLHKSDRIQSLNPAIPLMPPPLALRLRYFIQILSYSDQKYKCAPSN